MSPWNIIGWGIVGLVAVCAGWWLLVLALRALAWALKASAAALKRRQAHARSRATKPESGQRWNLRFRGQDYGLTVVSVDTDGTVCCAPPWSRSYTFPPPPHVFNPERWAQSVNRGELTFLYQPGRREGA